MDSNNTKEINIKLIIIGDSDVGKTTLIYRYTDNYFNEEISPTVGLDNKVKKLNIQGLQAKIQIWDTAGQEKYDSLTSQLYKNTDGIILVFDLTNNTSFISIKKYIDKIKKNCDHRIKKLLVGNKVDMKDGIKVNKKDIYDLCKNNCLKYNDVSAKENINVDRAFETIINSIIEKKSVEELIADYGIKEQQVSLSGSGMNSMAGQTKKKCC